MRSFLSSFALFLAAASLAQAAPAPFPREVADVKVRLKGLSLAKVTDDLRARSFALEVLKDKRVLNLACLKGRADQVRWLNARMKVRSSGDGLRITLENCPSKEAVLLLSAVVEAYINRVDTTRPVLRRQLQSCVAEQERIKELIARVAARNANVMARIDEIKERYAARVKDVRAQIARTEAAWVAQPPRAVPSSR
jgi:hypothetical protein